MSGPAGRPSRAGPSRSLPLAIFVLSLAVALLGVGWLLGRSPASLPPAGTPTPSPTAAASSPAPSPSPVLTPAATADAAAIEAAVAAVEAQVPAVRQLQPLASVPTRLLDPAQLADRLQEELPAGAAATTLAAQGRLLARLGLLPAGTDLRAEMLALLGSQVVGFYDDRAKDFAVVASAGSFGPLQRITVAHEYTHALQDQHFDLGRLGLQDTANGDRALARLSLVEGDASLSMTLWATAHLGLGDLLALIGQASAPASAAALAKAPPYLVQQLLFPYQQGLAFVQALYAQGGWAAVDGAYARPPDSSSQILHPELYQAGVEPLAVTLPLEAIARALSRDRGTPWRLTYADTLGEQTLTDWLALASSGSGTTPTAAGWAGDRAAMFEDGQGGWLIVVRTAWTSPARAATFAPPAYPGAPSTVATLHGSGSDVTTVVLSDAGPFSATLLGLLGGP